MVTGKDPAHDQKLFREAMDGIKLAVKMTYKTASIKTYYADVLERLDEI